MPRPPCSGWSTDSWTLRCRRSGWIRRRRHSRHRLPRRHISRRLRSLGTPGRAEYWEVKRTGAWLARYALEQLPVSHTFGIPGVHNTELYDQLSRSEKIRPILVTHEGCGAFAADAVSRTGGGRIGCLLI